MCRSNVITSWVLVKIFEPKEDGVIGKFTNLDYFNIQFIFQYLCSLHTVIGTMK
jgi:hypothetical protein